MTPVEYRQFAAECLQAAKLSTSEPVRATMLAMAQRWNELAARADSHAPPAGRGESGYLGLLLARSLPANFCRLGDG